MEDAFRVFTLLGLVAHRDNPSSGLERDRWPLLLIRASSGQEVRLLILPLLL